MNAEFIERLDRIGKEIRKLVADMKAAEPTACSSHTKELAKLEEEFGKQARILVETLALFNVDATVQRVEKGPTVDRVVFTVPPRTRYSKVAAFNLQRHFGWGYYHAAKILAMLQERGVMGSQIGAGSRDGVPVTG